MDRRMRSILSLWILNLMLRWCRRQPADHILRAAKYTNKFFKLLTAAPHSDHNHPAYQLLTLEEYEVVRVPMLRRLLYWWIHALEAVRFDSLSHLKSSYGLTWHGSMVQRHRKKPEIGRRYFNGTLSEAVMNYPMKPMSAADQMKGTSAFCLELFVRCAACFSTACLFHRSCHRHYFLEIITWNCG